MAPSLFQRAWVCTALLSCVFAGPAVAAQKPKEALAEIGTLRTNRIAEAKEGNKRVDFAALSAELIAKAKAAVKDVDPEKVDVAEASDWIALFSQAQDHQSTRAVAKRWAAAASGSDKFNAQVALITADYRLKNFEALPKTFGEAKPVDAAGSIKLATLANSYVLAVLSDGGKEAALKVVAAGEAAVAGEDQLKDEKERAQAARVKGELARTRKLIEDNPGKEQEALETARRQTIGQILAQRTGTNAPSPPSKEDREAKFAKLVGTKAESFKPLRALGEFKSVDELNGKVVILDFFAHWCGPCIMSLPSMRSLSDDFKDKGLRLIGVTRFYGYYKTENRSKRDMAQDAEFERMKEFVKEKNMNWPVAFVDKTVCDAFQCSAIPHVVVIDKAGKIRKVKVGYYPKEVEEFRGEIAKMVAE
jgi:thiol-disulfide isomerase/thioredoxin